ncbi:hypothetical protein Patl1_04322 [Pistacia atlantica]|uniref:Uncharacterized protein n=1 Tax=Pistacia atlantica TaxID=434234 RepID=A0ACC1BTF5_9ROSI|nr:hypothetical protein Patl1_04322 [Pistacia atlantica]
MASSANERPAFGRIGYGQNLSSLLYASIIGEDGRFELLAAVRSLIIVIVTTRLRYY